MGGLICFCMSNIKTILTWVWTERKWGPAINFSSYSVNKANALSTNSLVVIVTAIKCERHVLSPFLSLLHYLHLTTWPSGSYYSVFPTFLTTLMGFMFNISQCGRSCPIPRAKWPLRCSCHFFMLKKLLLFIVCLFISIPSSFS